MSAWRTQDRTWRLARKDEASEVCGSLVTVHRRRVRAHSPALCPHYRQALAVLPFEAFKAGVA